jgi:hypothetical protein
MRLFLEADAAVARNDNHGVLNAKTLDVVDERRELGINRKKYAKGMVESGVKYLFLHKLRINP